MSEQQMSDQILDHLIDLKSGMSEVKTKLDGALAKLDKHETDIQDLKKFRTIFYGLVGFVGIVLTWIVSVSSVIKNLWAR